MPITERIVAEFEFLSTLSLRRATENSGVTLHDLIISIHALLAESDMRSYTRPYRSVLFLSTLSLRRATGGNPVDDIPVAEISIHALLAESDFLYARGHGALRIFLSTLSLRRATSACRRHPPGSCYFYPRSPCGERRGKHRNSENRGRISIHALLAESDMFSRTAFKTFSISIHALLAESDPYRAPL